MQKILVIHVRTVDNTLNIKMNLKEKTTKKLESELKIMKLLNAVMIGTLAALLVYSVYGLLSKY